MSGYVSELLDRIEDHPDYWVVTRTPQHYDRFMNLLLDVRYPPIDPSQLFAWRQRTRATWTLQDELLPGNCTGGEDGDLIVSTLGALPISKGILYVHSGAMQRTLKAAASLLATALHTIEFLEQLPDLKWWMGLYTYQSRFVTLWQRPETFVIPDQLEVEELRVYPLRLSETNPECLAYVPLSGLRDDSEFSVPHQHFVNLLTDSDGPLNYRVREGNVVNRFGKPLCIALVGDSHEEMTAFNVPSWVWIFPTKDVFIDPSFVSSLLSIADFKGRVLRIVVSRQEDIACGNHPTIAWCPHL